MSSDFETKEWLPPEDYTTVTKASPWKFKVAYHMAIIVIYLHIATVYGLYLGFTIAMWPTVIFNFITFWLSVMGANAGAHRLWSHRAYKATGPLEIFLMLCQSIGFQYSVIHWVRDHRLHHKFSDTDADPHNPSRGLFFSHFGWLMVKRHPEVLKKGKLIDISDVESNPVLLFQDRHGKWFIPIMTFILPPIIPIYFWGETFNVAWNLNLARYFLHLNSVFAINSLAHCWGNKPYDKNMAPTQNKLLTFLSVNESNHNYHHVFPWDYRSDEHGGPFNIVANIIGMFAWLGLAYDLKTAPKSMIEARMKRTGDGSRPWAGKDSHSQ